MTQIEIPPQFQRNSAKVLALGLEKTGCLLLDRANALLGWPDLAGKDLLDVGEVAGAWGPQGEVELAVDDRAEAGERLA